ncbi:MAG: tRNA lysidine(34) synthetase TilS [Bacteroidetes bacterium]|nr:tRNA lysidine(34) synthetase TilS [Bacteroidota bacterium]
MNVATQFIEFVKKNHLFSKNDKLLLAVSGGVDSVVLTHLCKHAGFDFAIAHCNFQLRGDESDRDEQFVKELAKQLNVPFYSKAFDTKKIAAESKKGIEEAARDLRYEWFEMLLKEHSLTNIVTAHHADDNIETIVMRFFRGTGIKGLKGIPVRNENIVRPLLFARKQELLTYANENKLSFIVDSTNAEDTFTRNYFRNKLIPSLKEVYPSVEQNLQHNIERLNDAAILYEQAIMKHKNNLLEKRGEELQISVLKLKKTIPLSTIVFEIISDFGFSASQTDEVIALLDSDTGKYVCSSSHRILKNRNWLIISKISENEFPIIVIENDETQVSFGHGSLKLGTSKPQLINDHSIACLDFKTISFPLLLRKWKEGDYFYPLGMKKKKKIARFLIDNKLSKIEKERIWVLESRKKIIWIINHRIDDRFKIKDSSQQMLKIQFLPS